MLFIFHFLFPFLSMSETYVFSWESGISFLEATYLLLLEHCNDSVKWMTMSLRRNVFYQCNLIVKLKLSGKDIGIQV
jgi:hypothetical protein